MKLCYFFCIFSITLILLTGCSFSSDAQPETDSSSITLGSCLEIKNVDSRLTLRDNMDALAADGLYYASFTMGDSIPFENSDGDTVDLYDARLYLLAGQFRDSESSLQNMESWLEAAKSNYQILDEQKVSCGGNSYLMLTYNCVNESNPYARGVSAFGAFGDTAVCIELTCREDFDGDLYAILTDFLEGCSYPCAEPPQ